MSEESESIVNGFAWIIILLIGIYLLSQGCAAILDPDHSARQRSENGSYTQPSEGP